MQSVSIDSLIKSLLQEVPSGGPAVPVAVKKYKSQRDSFDIKQFWSHVNTQYFRNMDPSEPCRLVESLGQEWERVQSTFQERQKGPESIYSRLVHY